jgi:enamine deaminase RidA (YjgF/YER057c/UK114 family)
MILSPVLIARRPWQNYDHRRRHAGRPQSIYCRAPAFSTGRLPWNVASGGFLVSRRSAAIDARLREANVVLPQPAKALANYVPFVLTGSLLVISGQLPLGEDGKVAANHTGKLGDTIFHEAGRAAARLCAINILAQARSALGDLGRIERCVRLGGFINCRPDFNALAQIMNGASDFMVEILGDSGRHARSTIGIAQLPLDAAVEVEAMFEVVP